MSSSFCIGKILISVGVPNAQVGVPSWLAMSKLRTFAMGAVAVHTRGYTYTSKTGSMHTSNRNRGHELSGLWANSSSHCRGDFYAVVIDVC
jgi:hypothetical protein